MQHQSADRKLLLYISVSGMLNENSPSIIVTYTINLVKIKKIFILEIWVTKDKTMHLIDIGPFNTRLNGHTAMKETMKICIKGLLLSKFPRLNESYITSAIMSNSGSGSETDENIEDYGDFDDFINEKEDTEKENRFDSTQVSAIAQRFKRLRIINLFRNRVL